MNEKYVLVRTRSAGVFAGYLTSAEAQDLILINARRIWYWSGASSLSELAMKGTSTPNGCKFPAPVNRIHLFEVIEIIDVTEQARNSIESVKVWTSH